MIDSLKIGIKINEIFLKDKHKEIYILTDGTQYLFENYPFLNEKLEDFSSEIISKLIYKIFYLKL